MLTTAVVFVAGVMVGVGLVLVAVRFLDETDEERLKRYRDESDGL